MTQHLTTRKEEPMKEQQHEREPNRQESERSHEAEPRDGPRIYVASLSDYNAGTLHGRWIETLDDLDAMQEQIDEMLRASPTTARYGDKAEEWAIHDFEGFGPLRLGEYEPLSTIARLAVGITEHGLAFAAWAEHVGVAEADQLDRFEELYRGEWDSAEDYAEQLLDDMGATSAIDELPEWLQCYVELDVADFAHDLQIGGDITVVDKPDGGVWIWSGS